jgi:hypothetical protein
VRNAWFSGGVEWNAGVQGHTPLSCSPVFAARVMRDDGTPILRLYEWERIRCFPFQLDFWLPDGSPWLFLRARLINPHDHVIPMYWWSNIAVRETPDVRVLAPADSAYNFGYATEMKRVAIPCEPGGVDVTYPRNAGSSADYFFDIASDRSKWITALDAEGRGLIQTSTNPQRGRKLFVWGMSPGGRRWQEFLSEPGQAYIEIQAGTAQTQFECFPLPSRSELAWTEAYGLMEADPAVVHSDQWERACGAVEAQLSQTLNGSHLERVDATAARFADRPPTELLNKGSGWGALEQQRRARAGETVFPSAGMVFEQDSIGDEQAPWLTLLHDGRLPGRDPAETPGAWMIQPAWRTLLEQSIHAGGSGAHWLSWLHLGVMYYCEQRFDDARRAWLTSISLKESAWALRNLAICEARESNHGAAADLLLRAREQLPMLAPLTIECLAALIDAGRPTEVLQLLPQLHGDIRSGGRVRILEARAASDLGDIERAEEILMDGQLEVADLREGEQLLSDLWYTIQEKKASARPHMPRNGELREWVRRNCPPPKRIDFRQAYSL